MSRRGRAGAQSDESTAVDGTPSPLPTALFPPGALASAPVVPLLAMGSSFLVFEVAALVFHFDSHAPLAELEINLALGGGLTVVASVAQGLVIRGRSAGRRFLDLYARAILALGVLVACIVTIRGSRMSSLMAAAEIVTTAAALLLIRSTPYAEFATYFMLRRLRADRQRDLARSLLASKRATKQAGGLP